MFSKTVRNPSGLKDFLKILEEDSDDDKKDLSETPTTGKQPIMKLFDDEDDESNEKLEASKQKYYRKKENNEPPAVEEQNEDKFLNVLKSRNKITNFRLSKNTQNFSEGKLSKLLNITENEDLKNNQTLSDVKKHKNEDLKNTQTLSDVENPKNTEKDDLKNSQALSDVENTENTEKDDLKSSQILSDVENTENTENDDLKSSQILSDVENTENLSVTREVSMDYTNSSDLHKSPFVEANKEDYETDFISDDNAKNSTKSSFEAEMSNYREESPGKIPKPKTLILNSPKKRKNIKKSIYSLPDLSKMEGTFDYTCGKDVVEMAYMSWYKEKTTELKKLHMEKKKMKEFEKNESLKKKSQLEWSSKTAFESWKKNTDQLIIEKRKQKRLLQQKEKEKEIQKNENLLKSEKSFIAWVEKKKKEPKPKVKKDAPKLQKTDEDILKIEMKKKNLEKRFRESQRLKKKMETQKLAEKEKNEKLKLRKELIAQKNFEDWIARKEMTETSKKKFKILEPWIPPRKNISFK